MNRREFTAEELALVRCPTLIITGEDDTAQPPRNSDSMVAGIRGAKVGSHPWRGPQQFAGKPEAVTAAMRDLLQAAERPRHKRGPAMNSLRGQGGEVA